jgi:hypothetical protein
MIYTAVMLDATPMQEILVSTQLLTLQYLKHAHPCAFILVAFFLTLTLSSPFTTAVLSCTETKVDATSGQDSASDCLKLTNAPTPSPQSLRGIMDEVRSVLDDVASAVQAE